MNIKIRTLKTLDYYFAPCESIIQDNGSGAVSAPAWMLARAGTLDDAVRQLERRIGAEEVGRRQGMDAGDGFEGANGIVRYMGHVRLANGLAYGFSAGDYIPNGEVSVI